MEKMDSGLHDINKITNRLQEVQSKLLVETNPEVRATLQKEFDMLMKLNNRVLERMDMGELDELGDEIEKGIKQLEKKQQKADAKFERKRKKEADRFLKKVTTLQKKEEKKLQKIVREQDEVFKQFEENMAAMDALMGQIDGALGLDDQNTERKSRKEREADALGKRNKKISQEQTITGLKNRIKELGKTLTRGFGKGD